MTYQNFQLKIAAWMSNNKQKKHSLIITGLNYQSKRKS